jgi:pimeloyl-ACP methyl ester carboxylesterase
MRCRSFGPPRDGVPEVVVVQGMAVAEYLVPGVRALGGWTRAHLLELPGLAGSGEPPRELTVPDYAEAVTDWLTATRTEPVVLGGHSSGTQVAAEVAAGHHPLAGALMLASPTIDPAVRPLPRLALRFVQEGRVEPPGLTRTHVPEWRRAGPRRLAHLVRVFLRHDIEGALRRLAVPSLVLRGVDDVLSTPEWGRRLVATAPDDSHYVEVPGAHGFPWLDPHSWSEPARQLAGDL